MNTPTTEAMAGAKSPKTNRSKEHLSPDGKWRSFPQVPGLMQYIKTGTYFARAKVKGKVFRKSLETDVFTTAKQRLPDQVKKFQRLKAAVGTFAEARLLYEASLDNDHTLKPASKRYRMTRIAALVKSWPGLDETRLLNIAEDDCQAWAKKFSGKFDEQNFNNTLGTLRAILAKGGLGHDDNPAYKIARLGVNVQAPELPETKQFDKLVETIETAGAPQSHDCADLVRFLAFSGCRIGEARQVTWADVDMEHGEMKVWNGKRSLKSKQNETRLVPFIAPMRQLLERLKRQQNPQPSDRVCVLGECEKSLTRACKVVGVPRITHHDLRHLFASVCIESEVDIPTISRWLGHSDGGALAMKVYGHLRKKHSQDMAAKVTYGRSPENVIPLPIAVSA